MADYLAFAGPLTDAPQSYHVGVGLVVLGALLGNRVRIPFGARPLFPNLYVALLGDSTLSRKTTSIAIGQDLLRRFEGISILPAEFSPEAFLQRLQETPAALLVYPEFAKALGVFRRDYMAGMVERLTELYDCPPEYSRCLRQQTFTITQPVVSILAASTVEWLTRTMQEDDVRGGFFPRFVFFPATPRASFVAIPPQPDIRAANALTAGLGRLLRLEGMADLSLIRMAYERWYLRLVVGAETQGDGEALTAFTGRLSVTVLKLALLYHVAESDDLVIAPEALERALALTGWLQEAVVWLLQEGLTFGRWDKDRKRILGIIRRKPGIAYSPLLRLSHVNKRTLTDILDTLDAEESIVCQTNDGLRHYYLGPGVPSLPIWTRQ